MWMLYFVARAAELFETLTFRRRFAEIFNSFKNQTWRCEFKTIDNYKDSKRRSVKKCHSHSGVVIFHALMQMSIVAVALKLEEWSACHAVSGLSEESDDMQYHVLRLAFSRETATVIDNLGLPEEDRRKVYKIIDALKSHMKVMSSPAYSQSNGKSEATVKSMKKLIRRSSIYRVLEENKLARALLLYRNTPCAKDGLSPAQKL